ncbi:MAG: hypothetical protein FH748_02290 [Balneolaceae bacterium]|nr:hypothetical protein [Balneolaceae bacterium]
MIALLLFLITFQEQYVKETQLVYEKDPYISRAWNVEDGLPVNTVNSIFQDEQGYLWVATYDGMARFDGLEFEIYNHANTAEMAQNRADKVYRQEGVGVWVTLENDGVMLITPEGKFKHFDEKKGFISTTVTYMMEDSMNHMWFGTYDGLFKYENGTFNRIITRETASQNRISYIYEAPDHSIWMSTYDGLLHLYDNQVDIYNISDTASENRFNDVLYLNNGELVVGSTNGLGVMKNGQLFEPAKFEMLKGEEVLYIYTDDEVNLVSTSRGLYKYENNIITLLEEQPGKSIYYKQILKDSKGIRWLLGTYGEISQFTEGKLRKLSKEGVIPDLYYSDIFEDRERNIWLATTRNGIIRLKSPKIDVIGKEEGLSGNNILGIFEDSKGRFWIGTRDHGVNVLEGHFISRYREGGIMSRGIAHAFNEDHEGNIWVGYYEDGIERYNDEGVKKYKLGFEKGINDVRSIFIASDSTMWIGTHGGLVKFDPENEEHIKYTKEDGLAGNLVRYIEEDPKGGLWLGTADGGLSYFYDGEFNTINEEEGLASDNIRSIYVDKDDSDIIWVGTENRGLNRLKEGRIDHIGLKDDLPDHIIHHISEDENGWLWMSSNKGVFKVKKSELNAYIEGNNTFYNIIQYDREEGMRNPECNGGFQQGGLKTSGNDYWFATQNGIAIIEIEPNTDNAVPPIAVIRNVFAEENMYDGKEITLESGVKNFRINFHGLSYSAPEKVRFRYMLEGYDKGWKEVSNEYWATYTDVPAGTYTFKVLAASNDGVWGRQVTTASIEVRSIFYEQTWFYFLIITVVGITTIGFSKVRYQYLMRKQKKLKSVIREQTHQIRKEKSEIESQNQIIEKQAKSLKEINDAKDQFFSIIAHDLRNPFQAMMAYSEMLIEDFDEIDRQELRESLKEINDSSNRLHQLVENLLQWASLQTGNLKLNLQQFQLNKLINKNVKLVSPIAQHKNVTLSITSEEEITIEADKDMIDTVMRNLLSNALKFTNKGDKVEVEIYARGNTCYLQVSDTGIGMPEEIRNKLMKVGADTSRTGTADEKGSGLGLMLCKDMVHMHEGWIHVESEEGKGTVFIVELADSVC